MLNKLVNKVKEEYEKAKTGTSIDSEQFNDDVANQVSWSPLVSGGTSFRTHKLQQIDDNRVEVTPSLGSQIFTNVFLLVGALSIAFSLYSLYENNGSLGVGGIFLPIIGAAFCAGAIFMGKKMTRNKYFDKKIGYFWVGKKEPREVTNVNDHADFLKLSKVYAIQILKERVEGDESSFSSYEFNLVCKDLSRVNVMDHAKIDLLREEAKVLGEFLNIPVWDGSF